MTCFRLLIFELSSGKNDTLASRAETQKTLFIGHHFSDS
jgi:hypothetical protein